MAGGMDLDAYLARIDYGGPLAPDLESLRALHLAHLLAVPFENLDVLWGRAITLDLERIYDKIVVRRRGGFCYELNGLFAWLLGRVGFEVRLLSASDAREDGSYGLEYDHLALLVPLDGAGGSTAPARWLADVGWGDTFLEPLRLDEAGIQEQGRRAYRVEAEGAYRIVWQRDYDGAWRKNFRFTLLPRQFSDFAGMCQYHQTSPASQFTQKRIVTRATPGGRVSLRDERLITTLNGRRQERAVEDEGEFQRLLREQFGIELGHRGDEERGEDG